MRRPSSSDPDSVRERLIGLGERSVRKSYYPELQQRLADLKNVRNYLANIIDSMPSILAGVDRSGRVTQWNQKAADVSGVTAEEARGRPLAELLPILSGHMGLVLRAMETRRPQKAERVSADSGERFLDIVVYPLVFDSSVPDSGAVIRIDDVTSRVRLEEVMVQTEKMVSVGGLAAGMAHEINNPLGGILQGVQNIQRRVSLDLPANEAVAGECGTTLAAVRSYLDKRGVLRTLAGIREAGERAARIVENMLLFSRRSDDRITFVDLARLLDRAVELARSDYDLKKRFDFRRINVIREFDPRLPEVECSPTEIEQVVLNLLRNAAQAMADKEFGAEVPTITLRTALENGLARIEVEDNGPGMSEDVKRRIFEPFFTTKAIGVGTGLGLSVSYFIVTENHKGSMGVDTVPGRGARFQIRLPLVRSGQAASHASDRGRERRRG